MSSTILDTGLSVVYEAENSPPIVDIVFVHGLQGHPSKTWTYRPKTSDTLEPTGEKDEKRSGIRRLAWKPPKASPTGGTRSTATSLPEENDSQPGSVFWPADLLPDKCPDSRILTFGYDCKVTKYRDGAINYNSILSHSKDLLFSLRRERRLKHPLVFVAHSLGGIVVKEMLARSSSSLEAELRDIVESTGSIIFLGTPHRGSQDVAALGEVVRSVISSLGMETTPAILDALGLKTTDLSRAQEDFSILWQKHDFQVKTFQEGLSLAKIGKKVVPDYSSLIGDYREHAETLQANHVEMCRCSGKDDPNYHKIAGELGSIYRSIARVKATEALPARQTRFPKSVSSAASTKGRLSNITNGQLYEACLGSLWFPAIHIRYQSLETPANQTCSWLFNHEVYRDWFNSTSRQKSYGLLWLKGKPGSGKSTLMKEAFRRAASGQAKSHHTTAAFFFNAKGDTLERSCLALFQSLLYQLLPGDIESLQRFHKMWEEKVKFRRGSTRPEMSIWTELELKSFFESVLLSQTRRTIIFIDALDECDETMLRPMAYFWRSITESAFVQRAHLSVCLSSRHFPTITLDDCPEIIVEQHNSDDIVAYVDQKLRVCVPDQDPHWKHLRGSILNKSDGVFLWVVLVIEDVLRSWDDGRGMPYLTRLVTNVPKELEKLFSSMFYNLDQDEKRTATRLFQWVILGTKPFSLHEWHHIMAFIWQPSITSLKEWRQSVHFTDSDEQLVKQIRRISKGLVELKSIGAGDLQDEGVELLSVYAGAGSLNREQGNTRIVQVIHESVRDFFLKGNGLSMLDSSLWVNPIGNSHLSIINTCLDYINIKELDGLVKARIHAARRHEDSLKILENGNKGPTRFNDVAARNLALYYKHRLQHGKQSATGEEDASVFDVLRSLDDAPGVDIVEWMAKGGAIPGEQSEPDGSLCKSESCSSQLSRSRILEDDPALLSYATFRLFTHAQLAERCKVDPSPVVKRLSDRATWARWVTLREDVPEGTEMLAFAAYMGLSSWAKANDVIEVLGFDEMICQEQQTKQNKNASRARRRREARLKRNKACGIQQPNTVPDIRQPDTCILPDMQRPDATIPDDPLFTRTHDWSGDFRVSPDDFHMPDESDLQQPGTVADNLFEPAWNLSTEWFPPSPSVPGRPGSVASFSSAGSHNVSPWA
ncbi:uncharacterized protein Triagg1_1702 [Trichoderma aggressivum f. europaeum]|uniref:Nephrocystin 3-like N-terminal domain-containing protein n=1 Tax=Trichoderma aggressivum f. europaeum TaxID=173218 RepID=A0AAE1IHX7_9HYPO|nr:hypothetical protein Triagg1_1702 [Trichoderma aggressivum f. europaeum]